MNNSYEEDKQDPNIAIEEDEILDSAWNFEPISEE
jgi:hypothetical protein